MIEGFRSGSRRPQKVRIRTPNTGFSIKTTLKCAVLWLSLSFFSLSGVTGGEDSGGAEEAGGAGEDRPREGGHQGKYPGRLPYCIN